MMAEKHPSSARLVKLSLKRRFRTLHFQITEDDFDVIFLSNSGFGDARNAIAEITHDEFYGADSNPVPKIEMDKGYI